MRNSDKGCLIFSPLPSLFYKCDKKRTLADHDPPFINSLHVRCARVLENLDSS